MATDDRAAACILVVDDDAHVRDGLAIALELSGYRVARAANGAEALSMLDLHACDLMVLDMQMPGIDGVEVMRRARPRHPDLLIVVLTGHATLESAITAVKADAVDYILKPASVHDIKTIVARALEARAERLRRERALELIGAAVDIARGQDVPSPPPPTDESEGVLRWGALTLQPRTQSVTVDGAAPRVVGLSEGEAGILAALITHPGQVLSPVRLVHLVWGYEATRFEAVNIVRSHIYRLRQKLDADPEAPSWIRTVRGSGYHLVSKAERK